VIGGLLILPMNYEYISNLWGMTSGTKILWTSLTQVKQNITSYGVLALILTTWLSTAVILAAETEKSQQKGFWWKTLGSILGISGLISLFYEFWLSGSLAQLARMAPQNMEGVISQTASLEGLLTQFVAFLILSLLVLGIFLPENWPTSSRNASILSPFLAIMCFIIVIWLSVTTNLRIIHADTAFKMAEPFANNRQWAVANVLYRRAIELSPDEDYYYLFLGRGSLEEAKALEDPDQKEQVFNTAEADLIRAQHINPLNPDHTANLARLHSWWALQAPDDATRLERGSVSDHYYSRVMVLSPNSARLMDEWAILHLNVIKDQARAYEILKRSLEIDPKYDWTYAIMGDYYSQQALGAVDEGEKTDAFEQAIYYYQQAIQYNPRTTNYYFALASAYQSLNDIGSLIATLESSLEFAGSNEIWKIEDNLAHFYLQLDDRVSALLHSQRALAAAPESEQERLQNIVNQLQTSP